MRNCLIDGWEYEGKGGGTSLQFAQDMFLINISLFSFQISVSVHFWPLVVTLPEIKSGKLLWAHLVGWHQK